MRMSLHMDGVSAHVMRQILAGVSIAQRAQSNPQKCEVGCDGPELFNVVTPKLSTRQIETVFAHAFGNLAEWERDLLGI